MSFNALRRMAPMPAALVVLLSTLIATGCRQPEKAPASIVAPIPAPAPPQVSTPAIPRRDLSIDESMGGHTLARHVGKSDAELRDRLKRERQISAASTYTDRDAAERAAGAALASGGDELAAWQKRSGRRPNLVLHFTDPEHPLGRSLSRGQRSPVPASSALVVLRWDERADRFYVLTSYPEADR